MRGRKALFDDGSKLSCTILVTDELNVSEKEYTYGSHQEKIKVTEVDDEILSKAAKEFMQKFCEYGAKEIKKYIKLTPVLECPGYTTITCTVDFAEVAYNYAFVADVLKQIPPKDLNIILKSVYMHNNPVDSPVDIPDQAALCFVKKIMECCMDKKGI